MQPIDAIHGVTNAAQPLPNLVTGGQPTADHLRALKAAGVELVLDVRDPVEPRPFDEPALIAELGMEYVNIPVNPTTMNGETLDKIRGVLQANAGRRVFYHCASGGRVGGSLLPHFILDHGLSEEDAVQQSMRVGMRSAEQLAWGLDYVHLHGG